MSREHSSVGEVAGFAVVDGDSRGPGGAGDSGESESGPRDALEKRVFLWEINCAGLFAEKRVFSAERGGEDERGSLSQAGWEVNR